MMPRLIDADALMRKLCVQCDVECDAHFHEATCDPDECFVYNVIVYDAPTIDAEPVRHGRWELHADGSGTCMECRSRQKNVWDYDNWQRYCGCCGAKMDGGEKA